MDSLLKIKFFCFVFLIYSCLSMFGIIYQLVDDTEAVFLVRVRFKLAFIHHMHHTRIQM